MKMDLTPVCHVDKFKPDISVGFQETIFFSHRYKKLVFHTQMNCPTASIRKELGLVISKLSQLLQLQSAAELGSWENIKPGRRKSAEGTSPEIYAQIIRVE